MKQIIQIGTIILILFTQLNSFSQNEKDFPTNPNFIKKNSSKINESLYASKIEVSNKNYQCFLQNLKQNGDKEKLKSAYIDSLQWQGEFYHKPFVIHYHTHQSYQDYPVVNISYEGANLYCDWLTVNYNSNPKRKFEKVVFRLPTEKEWVNAAKGGDTSAIYPWIGDSLTTEKGLFRANFRRSDKAESELSEQNSTHDLIAPVYAYWPNKFDLYNMGGNVAEMVQEKGVSKGGSFLDYSDKLKIESRGSYDSKSSNQVSLGFRWFMEIIEE